MKDGVFELNKKLETLADALALVADEFAQTHNIETAVAGYVLAGMVMSQVSEVDAQLDAILEKPRI